jgi:reactive intermediate/imine deaminase
MDKTKSIHSLKKISDNSYPLPIGPYSVARKLDNTLYLSGQIGIDPETMQLADGVEQQMHRVFKNMQAVLTDARASLKDVVKVTIFITDMNSFSIVNQIMSEYFSEPYPARSTVGVKELPKGALVEVEGIVQLT